MQDDDQIPLLTEVINKIKQREPLTSDEEIVYLTKIEGMSKDDAKILVRIWYNLDGGPHNSWTYNG